jgi:hypothetical protein
MQQQVSLDSAINPCSRFERCNTLNCWYARSCRGHPLSLSRPPVDAAPKTAASNSGKVYVFPPNPLKVKSMSLMLTDPQPSYNVEIYAMDTTGSAQDSPGHSDSMDGMKRESQLTFNGWGIRAVNAVKGTWLDDHKFVISRLILGQGLHNHNYGVSHLTETGSTCVSRFLRQRILHRRQDWWIGFFLLASGGLDFVRGENILCSLVRLIISVLGLVKSFC